MSYLEQFKKTYDEIEGISQDSVITYFKGGFRSRMLYIELQLRKPKTIGEMFNIAQKVALTKGSAQESQPWRKERPAKTPLPPFEKQGKIRLKKLSLSPPLNVLKESLVTDVDAYSLD